METIAPTVAETIAQTMETIAETIPETIPQSVQETIPQVMEVVETTDYTALLAQIFENTSNIEYFLYLLTGCALFLVVVCLCYFCYKFFRIFF